MRVHWLRTHAVCLRAGFIACTRAHVPARSRDCVLVCRPRARVPACSRAHVCMRVCVRCVCACAACARVCLRVPACAFVFHILGCTTGNDPTVGFNVSRGLFCSAQYYCRNAGTCYIYPISETVNVTITGGTNAQHQFCRYYCTARFLSVCVSTIILSDH